MQLTILTPTLDRRAFLQECVASVQSSEVDPLELGVEQVVHDLGSTDGTIAWLREQDNPRTRALFSLEKMPPGRARNRAAGVSQGDYLLALDDDDVLLQRTAHHFVRALSEPSCMARWAVADFLRVDAERRYRLADDYYAWRFGSADEMLQAIFSGRLFLQGNVCFERSLFEQVGGYHEGLHMAEDLELYVRFLLTAGLPLCLPIVSHLHRMHDSNTSRGIDAGAYNQDLSTLYELHREPLEAHGIELRLL